MKKTILIIDDEPDILTYLRLVLEDQGYKVVMASDGSKGLDYARKEKPDLICLDVMMPKKTGVAVYTEMKSDPDLKDIPVIFISAYESAYTFKGKAFRRLIPDKSIPEPLKFFEKPLDIPQFTGFLDEHFSKSKKRKKS